MLAQARAHLALSFGLDRRLVALRHGVMVLARRSTGWWFDPVGGSVEWIESGKKEVLTAVLNAVECASRR